MKKKDKFEFKYKCKCNPWYVLDAEAFDGIDFHFEGEGENISELISDLATCLMDQSVITEEIEFLSLSYEGVCFSFESGKSKLDFEQDLETSIQVCTEREIIKMIEQTGHYKVDKKATKDKRLKLLDEKRQQLLENKKQLERELKTIEKQVEDLAAQKQSNGKKR